MKFLVPNYSCLQNPWLGGYRPQIPVLSVLCPQLNLLNPPPKKNIFLDTPLERGIWIQVCGRVARPLVVRPRSRLEYNIKMDEGAWTGLMWHITRTSGRMLRARQRIFDFHKIPGIFCWAEEVLARPQGFFSGEGVTRRPQYFSAQNVTQLYRKMPALRVWDTSWTMSLFALKYIVRTAEIIQLWSRTASSSTMTSRPLIKLTITNSSWIFFALNFNCQSSSAIFTWRHLAVLVVSTAEEKLFERNAAAMFRTVIPFLHWKGKPCFFPVCWFPPTVPKIVTP